MNESKSEQYFKPQVGFEPTTYCLQGNYSSQLSYSGKTKREEPFMNPKKAKRVKMKKKISQIQEYQERRFKSASKMQSLSSSVQVLDSPKEKDCLRQWMSSSSSVYSSIQVPLNNKCSRRESNPRPRKYPTKILHVYSLI